MRRVAVVLAALLLATPALAVGGKGATFANAMLKLFFQGVSIPSIADNTASTPATVLCVALHTADPGAGGTQTTNEAAYPGYARVAVPRTSAGWTVTGSSASPATNVNFPVGSGGPETETWFSVAIPYSGSTCTGALEVMYRGSISPSLVVNAAVTPQLTNATAINEN